MKARIPILIQDPQTSSIKGLDLTEGFDPDQEDFFLDGPVTRRLAVVDFDSETGGLQQAAHYVQPDPDKKMGYFADRNGSNLYAADRMQIFSPEFMQVSTFSIVLKTLYLFERKEVLGRQEYHPLKWAFDSPQLLIVPRAGQKANAYYHRDSSSLQFFYFPSENSSDKFLYTCLSRDIVAHETGHAIIDGIAPDLLDACSPQSLALHEALADLTALLVAFSSHNLREAVLKTMGGMIDKPTAFSAIAEEFGSAVGYQYGLRSLINSKNLNPSDRNNFVNRLEPHLLSEVLSGSLYNVMIKIHEDLKDQYAALEENQEKPDPRYSASGLALAKGAERFQRMVFRALDYLPPGEISFADHGRAMIAVDQVAYPTDEKMREWVIEEYLNRHIITDRSELEVVTRYDHQALAGANLENLYQSDWAAYKFANQNRAFLGIPEDIPFEVRPRLRVKKKYDNGKLEEECIFKVTWTDLEENPIGRSFTNKRRIQVGTTLVLDWNSGKTLVRLTNAPPPIGSEHHPDKRISGSDQGRYEQLASDRTTFLRQLADSNKLAVGKHGYDPDGHPLLTHIQVDVRDQAMRTRGTAKLLHIMREE